jgi:uncharacterized protein YbjT (DUF2867 family)
MAPRTVLVAGATGRFGAAVGLLAARGHRVRALTRDPSPGGAGGRLAAAGADVVAGDFDDPASLRAAMAGVDAVVASGTMHRAGPAGELRHGRNLVDAADAAGVGRLVWISGAGAGAPGTGVPFLEVKAEVEDHLRRSGVPATIVAPVYLMENLLNPGNLAALQAGRVPAYVPAGRRFQQVATADVVALVVRAVEHPGALPARIEVAGDTVSADDTAAALTAALHRPFTVEPADPAGLGPAMAALFRWLGEADDRVDVAALRRDHPDVAWHTFATWIDAEAGALATAGLG